MTVPICPYCGEQSKLVTGADIYRNRLDLANLKFWQCKPCDAYVGCHKRGKGTEPLGRLADASLRMWKGNAHTVFDPFWNGYKYVERRRVARIAAYARLAQDLNINPSDCHIGMFNIDMCKRVIKVCAQWRAQNINF